MNLINATSRRRFLTESGLLLTASLTINPAILVTIQAHVKEELGQDAGQAALPLALMGLGMAMTSFVVMRKGDMKNKGAVFQRAMMCGATITFLTGRTTAFGQVLVLAFLMGRVMGLYTLVNAGLMPFGALALGILASRIGTGDAISLAAAIGLAVVVTTYVRNTDLRRLG